MTPTSARTTTAFVHRRLGPIVGLLALLLAVFAFPANAGAQEAEGQGGAGSSGGDNIAIALNTKDGSSLFKYAFSITKATGEVVDAGNAAVASASCTECETVAVAIQFVIVEGSPDVFTPVNVAIATNESCTLCETMAFAYQVVIQTDGPVRLTGDGRHRLHELLKRLKELEDADLGPDELHAQLDDLVHQMTQVLTEELVPIGNPDAGAPAAASTSTTTSTTVRDEASTTSTTETVRSTTTTTRTGSTTTTTTSSPTTTSTTTSSTTTSTAP